MRYVGSKARHAKALYAVMGAARGSRPWVGPFVGGGNMIASVDGERYGNDADADVVILLQALAAGWQPPGTLTEREYNRLKTCKDRSPERSFAGFCCSYAGKWFGGYARAPGTKRDLTAEGASNVRKQAPNLKGVHWTIGPYDEMHIPPFSLVYCDPPYSRTQSYKFGAFDTEAFWLWCDRLVSEGHKVFVSEYSAPAHWTCVWSKNVANTLDRDTGAKRQQERLFTRKLGLEDAVDYLGSAIRGLLI